jgi:hypothetical protein
MAAPAHAENSPSDSLDALASVSAKADTPITDVLSNVAQVPTVDVGVAAIDATVGGVEVTVPSDSSTPVSLVSPAGVSIDIALPFAKKESTAEVVTDGVVSYDNKNNSTTAVVVKNDGSVQLTSIIENAAAPSAYAYPLDLPQDVRLETQADGGILILDKAGNYIAGISPAWAKDANGAELSTHYLLDGTTLTQVVEHTSTAVAYPVVADPWLGMQLISSTSWSGNTLRVYPTDYGRWGASLARSAAWDEVKAKTPGTRENTSSMTDQFLCHYDVRPITSTKASWNLDLNRPYINYAVLLANKCNN